MASSKEISYFRIGSFVITAVLLLVIIILIFGSGMLFKKYVYVETYFNESVQGLSVGSPVKYLGMEIGTIKEIAAVDTIYPTARKIQGVRDRYIYVRMAITPKFFRSTSSSDISKEIKDDVASGLRVKLALQGLTGNAYLELDFVNPKNNPPLTIGWQPDNSYIPSTTSILTYFSDNVQHILGQVKQVDFKKLFNNLLKLINTTSNVANKTNRLLSHTNQQIIGIVNNMHTVSENLEALSEEARAFPAHMLFGKPPPRLDLKKL